jgi:formyl-CoA transferase
VQALHGIRVVDLTRVVAGPYCTYQLALMGADVIKIEQVGRGDPVRWSGAGTDCYFWDRGMATNFLPQNANKRSLTLDLKSDRGRAIAIELVKRADVLVENFRAGAMRKLELSYDDLRETNPRLIYCSLTGYGQLPPTGHYTAYDGVIQAAGGMMSVIGTRETGPLKVGPPITDYASGMAAAFAITSALFQRERDGGGQYIDVSMLDTSLALMSSYVTDYFCTGNPPGPRGNEPASKSPSAGTYTTSEGRINLGANEDHQYRRLCRALGLEHLLRLKVSA